MMNKTLPLAVLVATMSMAVHAQSPPMPSKMGVVLTGKEARIMLGLSPKPARNEKAKLWTPTTQDIVQLEKDLPNLTKQGQASDPKFDAAGYNRQYVGQLDGGRRLIVINGFTPETVAFFRKAMTNFKPPLILDWHTQPFVVCDGGHSIFTRRV